MRVFGVLTIDIRTATQQELDDLAAFGLDRDVQRLRATTPKRMRPDGVDEPGLGSESVRHDRDFPVADGVQERCDGRFIEITSWRIRARRGFESAPARLPMLARDSELGVGECASVLALAGLRSLLEILEIHTTFFLNARGPHATGKEEGALPM
jgi:hypothetical protein